jgi:hypothetical protein
LEKQRVIRNEASDAEGSSLVEFDLFRAGLVEFVVQIEDEFVGRSWLGVREESWLRGTLLLDAFADEVDVFQEDSVLLAAHEDAEELLYHLRSNQKLIWH